MRLRDHTVLRDLMRARGVTDAVLAQAAGYRSKTHIVRLRLGRTPGCGAEYAARIAHKLGADVNALFSVDPSDSAEPVGQIGGAK